MDYIGRDCAFAPLAVIFALDPMWNVTLIYFLGSAGCNFNFRAQPFGGRLWAEPRCRRNGVNGGWTDE